VATDHLQEYLIGLGFDVDQNKLRKFREGAAAAAKDVTEIGAAAVTTAAAIGYMVEKAARSYEELFYASQRTGQSVASLKAFEFASRQVGISAESARGATEAFYATMRTRPGAEAQLAFWGDNDPKGGPLKLVESLKAQFAGMGQTGYAIAATVGQSWGLDEKTFKQMWDNAEKLEDQIAKQKAHQAEMGVGTDQMTEKFLTFSRAVNQLEADFGNLGERFGADFVEPATSVVEAIDKIVMAMGRLDKETGGEVGVATALGGSALAALLFKKLIGKIARKFGGKAVAEAAAAVEGGAEATGSGAASFAARWALGPLGFYFGSTKSTAGKAEDEPLSKEFRDNPTAVGSDRDMLIRTVLGEAANQSDTGQEAVAEVVLNRLQSGRYGKSLQDVVLAPKQFEPWQTRRNELMAISPDSSAYQRTAMLVDKVLRGEIADPTHGATHFANVGTVQARGNTSAMSWINDMIQNGSAVQIGDHLFGSPNSQPGANRFAANLAPSPMQTATNVTINHDTDINLYGNTDQAGQTAIANSQSEIYAAAVRNNLPRTR
jgi:hypothetical protein